MFNDEARLRLSLRLLFDRLEVTLQRRGLKLSERLRQAIEDNYIYPPKPKATASENRLASLWELAERRPSELVCYWSHGLGAEMKTKPAWVMVHIINKEGEAESLFTARLRSLAELLWRNMEGTEQHHKLFPTGKIERVSNEQVVIDGESLDQEALTSAVQEWLEQYCASLQGVPVRWLTTEEALTYELDSLAQSVGYKNLQDMVADAKKDQEQD